MKITKIQTSFLSKYAIAPLLLFFMLGCESKIPLQTYETPLAKVINSNHRLPENKVRDVYRNPEKTLEFFEVKPDMKVVEVSPGKGWYTEILGPYLKDKGELYLAAASPNTEVEYFQNANKALKDLIESHKDLYGKITYTTFEPPTIMGPVAPPSSVDRVVTFRNVHNWMKLKKEKEAFQEFYNALKPGGIFGIVEHREKLTKTQDPEAKSGYVREDYIIELAESVGFKFISKSEVNANYNDTANHPEGVWTLPPALRLKEKNRAYYLSIGESDRMTLKFLKPIDGES